MKPDAVLIAGPTASGKSAAALALAERIGGTIVNTDSMQVYREARILTARPSDEDMARAPHLLYGHVSVHEPYSVARYQADAIQALAAVRTAKRVPIFTGGTGLYFGALTEGLAEIPYVPADIRAKAHARFDEIGADAFFAELVVRDPDTRLRASDRQRVLRAYEVLEATGRPLAHWQKNAGTAVLDGLEVARFVISPSRAELHRRIDTRFETMLASGAMDEAAALGEIDPALPSAKILGRRELLAFRAGALDLPAAKTAVQAATRQYAKRQFTWFRHRMADWQWIEAEHLSNILAEILSHLA
jgi:tRNA dimethylallyltransferase